MRTEYRLARLGRVAGVAFESALAVTYNGNNVVLDLSGNWNELEEKCEVELQEKIDV